MRMIILNLCLVRTDRHGLILHQFFKSLEWFRTNSILFCSFVGESMADDSAMVFAYYKEGATDPTFLYIAPGLKEVKCWKNKTLEQNASCSIISFYYICLFLMTFEFGWFGLFLFWFILGFLVLTLFTGSLCSGECRSLFLCLMNLYFYNVNSGWFSTFLHSKWSWGTLTLVMKFCLGPGFNLHSILKFFFFNFLIG